MGPTEDYRAFEYTKDLIDPEIYSSLKSTAYGSQLKIVESGLKDDKTFVSKDNTEMVNVGNVKCGSEWMYDERMAQLALDRGQSLNQESAWQINAC